LKTESFRAPSRFLIYLIILTHVLTGCATTSSSGNLKTGPQLASAQEQNKEIPYQGVKLDVIIPVFSPGLSDSAAEYEEEGIWPELRRAEANRFAYKLKTALDESGKFGAVRVAPNSTASGDLFAVGEIIESNGQELEFSLNVVDASGKQWLNDTIEYEVGEGFYKNPRNDGKDSYDPAFDKAAQAIIEALLKQQQSELAQLQNINDLRFAASFNEQAFMEYLDTSGQQIKLVSMPSDADPMFQRVKSIQVREQLFVDNLQQNYSAFSQQMDDSYLAWQEASATEMQLRKEAKTKSIWKMIGGAVLIGAAVAAATSGSSNDPRFARDLATVAGGVGGAVLISSGFKSREEAKFHQEALNELGESVNLEMAPQVMTYEEESVELTGDIDEQFRQWRDFLNRMYQLEATPDVQL
jgi:outer membrane lipoprotein SlyB